MSAETASTSPTTGARPPRGVEFVSLLRQRRPVLAGVALAVAALGILLAGLAPGLVSPEPLVGAAVGLAACLLAVAVVIAVDAGDLLVRGPRHVRAAGSEVGAVVPGEAGPDACATLAEQVDARCAADGPQRMGLVPADSRTPVGALADALAVAVARRGRNVLLVELTAPAAGEPGIAEVGAGDTALGRVVRFDPELMLARVGPGYDRDAALRALEELTPRFPADIDVLVTALPPLRSDAAVAAAAVLGHVSVLATVGTTSRVDLLATLEALDREGRAGEVVLLDPDRQLGVGAPTAASGASAPEPRAEPTSASEVAAEPAGASDVETTVAPGAGPDVAPGPEPAPQPEPQPAPEPEPQPAPEPEPQPAFMSGAAPEVEATVPVGGEDTETTAEVPVVGDEAASPPTVATEADDERHDGLLRATVALQTLAQEIWARHEPGTEE